MDDHPGPLMALTYRRAWALRVVTLVIAVAVAGTGAWWLTCPHHRSHDCATVRAMIDDNESRGQAFAHRFDPDRWTQASIADYQDWADHIRGYATSITDPELSSHAHRLADEAQRFVAFMAQVRSETNEHGNPLTPPPWEHAYIEMNRQFVSELAALDKACPVS